MMNGPTHVEMADTVVSATFGANEAKLTYQDCKHITLHTTDGQMYVVKDCQNSNCVNNYILCGLEPFTQLAVFHALRCLFLKKQQGVLPDAVQQERLDSLDNFTLSVLQIIPDNTPQTADGPFDNVFVELEVKWTQNGEQKSADRRIECISISPAQFAGPP